MPLPKAREQQAATMTAARELSTRPGMDMVFAGPRKPRKFSKLVLLTASKDSAKVAGAKHRGVHCIMSLGVPGSATLAKALLKTHPEAQRALEAPPEAPEQKRCKPALDADAEEAVQLSLDPPVGGGEGAAPHPRAPALDLDPAPEQAGGRMLLSP